MAEESRDYKGARYLIYLPNGAAVEGQAVEITTPRAYAVAIPKEGGGYALGLKATLHEAWTLAGKRGPAILARRIDKE